MNPLKFIIFIIFATLYGCGKKAYSDEKLAFSAKYLALVHPYLLGDTLVFENKRMQKDTIIITRIDSIIRNTLGPFINERPYKLIRISCRQLPFDRLVNNQTSEQIFNNSSKSSSLKDEDFIFINKYPDNQDESFDISFKHFRGEIEKGLDSLIGKPKTAGILTLSNYYRVDNVALDLVKDRSDAKVAFITVEKGLIAYQDQQGEWWTRIR